MAEMAEKQGIDIECGKFKIELRGVGKRVVVLPVHITLEEVNEVVQALFGWEHDHMWEFKDEAGRRYGDDLGPGWKTMKRETPDLIPAAEVCLSDVLPDRGGKLRYEYDFGDGWCHVITRMADPKEPGRYCAETDGPDGIEDCGGPWGLRGCKDEWHVPDAGEITSRLERVRLKPRKGGTGIFRKEAKELEFAIRDLSDLEWEWLGQLAEHGSAVIGKKSKRLDRLVRLLPGVRFHPRMGAGNHYGEAEPEFRKLWRKQRGEWARLRGAAGSEAEAVEAELGKIPKAVREKMGDFARAAACLYGAVGEQDLLELFEHWRDAANWLRDATRETAALALQIVRKDMFAVGARAYVHDGLAISADKYPQDSETGAPSDAALAETLGLRQGKERWHPAAFRDFLAWGYWNGEPPEGYPAEYDRLKRFLVEVWDLDLENLEDEIDTAASLGAVYAALAAGRGWREAVNVLRVGFDMSGLTSREFTKLAELLVNAANATRHDANWGFTPNEMVALVGHGDTMDLTATPMGFASNPNAPIVRKTVKIGRNDPCPCGSGKKYKKCCGKNA